MDVVRNIAIEAEAAKVLLANIRAVIGDDEDMAADAIEGETNLMEVIGDAVKRLQIIRAFMGGIAEQIKALDARMARFERQDEHIRQAILVAMADAGLKTLELPTATITRKALAPKVEITSEADIPPAFWKPSDPKLDRKALLDALKDNQRIPGAVLSNGGETLQIKGD